MISFPWRKPYFGSNTVIWGGQGFGFCLLTKERYIHFSFNKETFFGSDEANEVRLLRNTRINKTIKKSFFSEHATIIFNVKNSSGKFIIVLDHPEANDFEKGNV